jgi:uncharacterized membrane protein YfcA
LEEIRQWLLIYQQQGTKAQLEEWVRLADRQLAELSQQKETLQASIADLAALRAQAAGSSPPDRRARHLPWIAGLPWRMRFARSGLYISPLAPLILGALVGVLTVILGIGGGFIMVPAMVYVLGMRAQAVVGTSLFQIIFVTAATTLLHATSSKSVDIVLALLLLVGGVTGAQVGVRAAQKLAPDRLRLALAVLVLLVAARLAFGLTLTPAEPFALFEGA